MPAHVHRDSGSKLFAVTFFAEKKQKKRGIYTLSHGVDEFIDYTSSSRGVVAM